MFGKCITIFVFSWGCWYMQFPSHKQQSFLCSPGSVMAMSFLPLQAYQLVLKYFHPITDHINNPCNVDHIQKHLMVLLGRISKWDCPQEH